MPAYAAASRQNRSNLNVRTGSPKQLESFNLLLGHTWANWKLHWTAAFAKMRDISRMMTGDTTFGANHEWRGHRRLGILGPVAQVPEYGIPRLQGLTLSILDEVLERGGPTRPCQRAATTANHEHTCAPTGVCSRSAPTQPADAEIVQCFMAPSTSICT
jgi:hypothetical protein